MHRLVLLVVGLFLLLVPPTVSADVILVDPEREDGYARFGVAGFAGELTAVLPVAGAPTDMTLVVDLVAGPLVRLAVLLDEFGEALESTYVYPEGRFIMTGQWAAPDGSTASARFVAPIPNFQFTVTRERDDQCSGDACPGTTGALLVGPGLFDPVFAQVLGVQQTTAPFGLDFYLELITDDPSVPLRFGNFNAPNFSIPATAAPEPATLALALVAGGMLLRRARRAAARSRHAGRTDGPAAPQLPAPAAIRFSASR